MESYCPIRVGVTIGFILLFLGSAIAPSITPPVVSVSTKSDQIEIITQTCGIDNLQTTTVQLTEEQYQNLKQYLLEFRTKMNQTRTRQDTINLFREAVIQLHTYGLLPKDISIEEAQRLVTGQYPILQTLTLSPSITGHKQLFGESNFLCLLTGSTTRTYVIGPAELGIAAFIYLLYFPYFFEQFFATGSTIIADLLVHLRDTCSLLQTLSQRRIIQTGTIVFGTSKEQYLPEVFKFFPASGWIDTQGLLGKRSWNGTFFGGVRNLRSYEFQSYTYYVGATGFIGIKIKQEDGTSFFLGSALHCALDYFEYNT
jgi:hypothetical protein